MIHDSFELFMIRDDPYNNPDDILKFFFEFLREWRHLIVMENYAIQYVCLKDLF